MQDWKVNQKIFQALGTKTDILGIHIPNDCIIYDNGNQIPLIEMQFHDMDHIYIPAKSYCVALVYATELVKDFGGNLIDYLSDSELLLDDIHFVSYNKSPGVYDYFIYNTTWVKSPMAEKIRYYYRQEMLLEGFNNAG